jgi:hypothetical protein
LTSVVFLDSDVLPEAVEDCIEAAGLLHDPEHQKQLMRAAQVLFRPSVVSDDTNSSVLIFVGQHNLCRPTKNLSTLCIRFSSELKGHKCSCCVEGVLEP